jgi:hypothetical protein
METFCIVNVYETLKQCKLIKFSPRLTDAIIAEKLVKTLNKTKS